MSVPEGETTIRHLRSASWYGNQVHEQLKTISNRTEFLSEEVASHRRDAPKHGTSIRALSNAVRPMILPANLTAAGLNLNAPTPPRLIPELQVTLAPFLQRSCRIFSLCAQVLTCRRQERGMLITLWKRWELANPLSKGEAPGLNLGLTRKPWRCSPACLR